jgi:DNA ligase-1
MQKMIKGCKFRTITVLKQERIFSQEDFDRWSKYVEDGNWEGFMLRKDVPFETGRTKNLLKVKKFMDMEMIVQDIEIDEMTTAEPGQGNVTYTGVKALLVPYKGNIVRVGSGLTKEQRIRWKDHPEEIIGKTVTVQYFESTTNQNGQESLRFPILKYVYENGRDC